MSFRHTLGPTWILTAGLTAGCTTIGRIGNLTDGSCQSDFSQALSKILVEQDEKPEIATGLADRTLRKMVLVDFGPRPFLVSSPSGADYSLFVQSDPPNCLLRLYGRQKGFWSYTNDLTYMATEPLSHCVCSDE